VAELRARGVVFEEYRSGQLQTVDGIATTRGGRAAWFKDSEGNILGLAQTS
jgi:predicted enzyme related to lactoylglutathione lyase